MTSAIEPADLRIALTKRVHGSLERALLTARLAAAAAPYATDPNGAVERLARTIETLKPPGDQAVRVAVPVTASQWWGIEHTVRDVIAIVRGVALTDRGRQASALLTLGVFLAGLESAREHGGGIYEARSLGAPRPQTHERKTQ
jgi:hypothetical protein